LLPAHSGFAPQSRPAGRYTAALAAGVEGLRIAVVKEGFGHPNSESDVDAHVREAAQRFAKLGTLVEQVRCRRMRWDFRSGRRFAATPPASGCSR